MAEKFDYEASSKRVSESILNSRIDDAIAQATLLVDIVCSDPGLSHEEAGVFLLRGYALSEAGRYEQAIVDLDRAIEKNSKSGTAYALRGVAHRKLLNPQQAKADLINATRFSNRRQSDEFLDLADLYMAELQFLDAIKCYTDALQVDYTLYGSFRRAESLIELGQLDEAEEQSKTMEDESPEHGFAIYGWTNLVRSEYEFSRNRFAQAIAAANDDASVSTYYGLGWLVCTCPIPSVRDPGLALQCAEKIRAIGTIENWETERLVAMARAGKDEWEIAIEKQELAIEQCPDWAREILRFTLEDFHARRVVRSAERGGLKWFPTRTP